MRPHPFLYAGIAASLALAPSAQAEDYVIDTQGSHAFIQFKVSHLGYSWVLGRFNQFDGQFSYDEKHPELAKVQVNIDPASLDSNHAERDKHLRGKDFLDVRQFPKASFRSTAFADLGAGRARLDGELNLRGVTRPISIEITQIGHGSDPWGGYRRGFEGRTRFRLKDFGIPKDLGPTAQEVEIQLVIEGLRQEPPLLQR